MGRRQGAMLRELVGALKDKVAITKTALLSDTSNTSLAVLRATTHWASKPAAEKHLSELLSFGRSSRVTASSCVASLMDRLYSTRSSSVALKSLLAIHHISRRGSFILQDQLSFLPSTGGHNYLNLSSFRDPRSLPLSSWVRWYARTLEQLIYTSKFLGFYLSSPPPPSSSSSEKLTSLSSAQLFKEINSLLAVVEEISKAPDFAAVKDNRLVAEVVRLVEEDNLMTQKEILIRLVEMRDRLGWLNFAESVELVCVLKRLDQCQKLMLFLKVEDEKIKAGDVLVNVVEEMKEKVGVAEEHGGARRRVVRGSESARFSERAVVDSVRFSSGRLEAKVDRSGW